MIRDLRQKKAEYNQELYLLNQNLKARQAAGDANMLNDVVPTDTEVVAVVRVNKAARGLELFVSTNNACVIKGCILFAEQVFDGESMFVHPQNPEQTLSVPICPANDTAVDMLIKVGTARSLLAMLPAPIAADRAGSCSRTPVLRQCSL
jgi:Ciliary BBSome complex subunit 2, C-terminal